MAELFFQVWHTTHAINVHVPEMLTFEERMEEQSPAPASHQATQRITTDHCWDEVKERAKIIQS